MRDIKFIKVPEIKAQILGTEMVLMSERFIPITVINTEKQDSDTNKIPDITVETSILGKKQELYIEIFYKHEIDESKRKMYNYYNKNCIEVDISDKFILDININNYLRKTS